MQLICICNLPNKSLKKNKNKSLKKNIWDDFSPSLITARIVTTIKIVWNGTVFVNDVIYYKLQFYYSHFNLRKASNFFQWYLIFAKLAQECGQKQNVAHLSASKKSSQCYKFSQKM